MTTTKTSETAVAVGTKTINDIEYRVYFTDDPECPVLLKRISHTEELGHKGRSWTGR